MLTAELLDEIQREIKLPVRRAIVTHSHADRIAGADLLRQRGIPVFAHPLTCRRAAAVAIAMPSDSLAGLRKPGDAEFVGIGRGLLSGTGALAGQRRGLGAIRARSLRRLRP
jgi:metallo-beta-lactamase class B VIM